MSPHITVMFIVYAVICLVCGLSTDVWSKDTRDKALCISIITMVMVFVSEVLFR